MNSAVSSIRPGFIWRKLLGVTCVTLATLGGVKAQTGNQSFASIELPGNAQLSALGGVNVSLADENVNFFQSNPALTSDSLNEWASANYLFYFAGTGLSNIAYQHKFKGLGLLAMGVQHLSLGSFQGYDLMGAPLGTYTSGETTVTIGKSHQANNFRVGVNMKGMFSNLAGYRASALLFDFGGAFVHPHKDLTVGLVIKNMGFVLQEFSTTSSSSLPFDIQTGVSFKPEHMPMRFSLTAYHLNKFDITYYNVDDNTEKANTLDKVTSHLTFGTEIMVHRNVNLLVGYNFLRHRELKLESAGGGSGVSVGFVAKVRNLNLSFSRSGYVSGGAYQLSLSVNTNKLLTRK